MIATVIMFSIAVLGGFGVWLGHAIATKIFLKIVTATGITGEFIPYVIVFGAVVLVMALLVGVLVFVLHKRFNLFKQIGKIYGFGK